MRVAILTALLMASSAFATSYGPPRRHDVYSYNWAYVLDVNPETNTHTVYSVWNRTTPLWTFSCEVWHFPFLVSNDGQVVATVSWRHVKEEDLGVADAVAFWTRDGKFRSHTLHDLEIDQPQTQAGPIGDFWRTWYTGVTDHGDSFTIHATDGFTYRFRYADGELVEPHRPGFRRWVALALLLGGVLTAVGIVLSRRARRRSVSPQSAATLSPSFHDHSFGRIA